MLNAIVSGCTTSSAPVFLFFRELSLKFVIYDVVSLSWPGKPIVIPHDDTNVNIFQKKIIFFSVKFNVVLKERLGFAQAQFVLNLHIFQPYCSRTLIFAGTYFSLIFRNIRKLIFVNNARFFIRGVFIRNNLRIVKI